MASNAYEENQSRLSEYPVVSFSTVSKISNFPN